MPYIFGKLWHLAIIWAIRKAFQCILQGVRFFLANHTRLSPTSENESYSLQVKARQKLFFCEVTPVFPQQFDWRLKSSAIRADACLYPCFPWPGWEVTQRNCHTLMTEMWLWIVTLRLSFCHTLSLSLCRVTLCVTRCHAQFYIQCLLLRELLW